MSTLIRRPFTIASKRGASCFRPALALLMVLVAGPVTASSSAIEHASVAEALSALKATEGARVSTRDGWTVVAEPADAAYILWSFTPALHPAHPAAVKRRVFQVDGEVRLEMDILCEGEPLMCEALVEEFNELNRQMAAAIAKRQGASGN